MTQCIKIAAGAALLTLATTVAVQAQDSNNTLVANTTLTSNMETAAPARPGEYRIKLNRPMQVGQRMHVHAEGSETRNVSSMTKGVKRPVEAGSVVISFDADAEIREVDAMGRPMRVVYTIKSCMMTIDGSGEEIAPKGARLTAHRKGSMTKFDIGGRPLSPAAANALGIVISLDRMEATDDELLGTDSPRVVGESWKIDTEKTAAEFAKMRGATAGTPKVSGLSTFVDVQEHQGQNCLFIQSQVTAENMVPGLGELPPGMELKSSTMTSMFQRLFPEDERLPSLSDFMRTDVNAVLANRLGNTGQGDEMHVEGLRMAELTVTPLSRTSDASGAENEASETVANEMAVTGAETAAPDSD